LKFFVNVGKEDNKDRIHQERTDLLISFRYHLNNKGFAQERRVYSILDMIGDIGGFNDALILMFKVIVSTFTGSMFYMDLIPSLFTVRHESAGASFRNKK
jgi:hypothetical protein